MHTESSHYPLFNRLPEGVVVADERGVILFANDAFVELLGYDNDILEGLNLLSLLEDVDVFAECVARVMEKGKTLNADTAFVHRDGTVIHTVKSVQAVRENGENRFYITVRNLTEADRLNRELRHSKELIEHQAGELSTLLNSKHLELEEILGSISEVIWYIDDTTLELRYVNQAVEELFALPKEMFLANQTLWQQRIHPDDRALVKTFFETLLPGQSQKIRFRILRSDEELRWISSRIHHHPTLRFFIGITSDVTASVSAS
ncbi:MAG: PAS domain S-box protein [Campylobacterota bacterium]